MGPRDLSRSFLAVVSAGLLTAACAGPGVPVPSRDGPASTRFSVQWHAYIGSQVGVAVHPEVAFIDYVAVGGELPEPRLSEVFLAGAGGAVAASVETVGIGHDDDAYRAVNVLLRVDGLPVGIHHWDTLRYRDAGGVQREIAIGAWTVEIVARGNAGLTVLEASAGASQFRTFHERIQNDLDQPVTVEGLRFELPGLNVRAAMRAEQSAGPVETGRPIPTSSSAPATEVIIGAGDARDLAFDFVGAPADSFVILQPFLRYATPDGQRHEFALPPQRYAPGFDGPGDLVAYLETLPAAASHPLTD